MFSIKGSCLPTLWVVAWLSGVHFINTQKSAKHLACFSAENKGLTAELWLLQTNSERVNPTNFFLNAGARGNTCEFCHTTSEHFLWEQNKLWVCLCVPLLISNFAQLRVKPVNNVLTLKAGPEKGNDVRHDLKGCQRLTKRIKYGKH